LDRPTRCRHIHETGSARPNLGPDFSQHSICQSVIEFDIPTVSAINTVELSR
jgi:hypothetical protein